VLGGNLTDGGRRRVFKHPRRRHFSPTYFQEDTMGFHRQIQPAAHDRKSLHFVVEREMADLLATDMSCAAVMAEQDPFGIDNDCTNPAGHYPIRSHGEIVCPHCSKVLWS
jgi:hypothetical protein